jgi:hypothetical protein
MRKSATPLTSGADSKESPRPVEFAPRMLREHFAARAHDMRALIAQKKRPGIHPA